MMELETIAALTVAATAVAGVFIHIFKKERPWRKITEDHTLKLSTLDLKVKHNTESVDRLREDLNEHDERDQKDFEKLNDKIEKLTDLMIQLIQQGNKGRK